MKKETVNKLNKINKGFYDKVAPYFDSSRQVAWTGWENIWDFIIENQLPVYSILDVGCGNARFYKFLQEKINLLCTTGNESVEYAGSILKNDFKYFGVDNNDFLLGKANEAFKEFKNFIVEKQDLLNVNLKVQKYEIISIFGVMHHIPGYENRLNLLNKLKENLSDDGIICVSFWQFAKDKKESEKISNWENIGINDGELEENDFLLSWNRGIESYRYCHNVSDDEIKRLIDESNLKLVREYSADGKSNELNKYILLANK